MNLKVLVLSLSIPFFTVGCTSFTLFPGVHKISVQQGNIVDQEMVDELKLGMTKGQVRFVLGTPLIVDTFNHDRWDYYYALKLPNDVVLTKEFSVFFKEDKLDSFEGDFAPEGEKDAENAKDESTVEEQ